VKLLECWTCERLFAHVRGYASHACVSKPSSASVLVRGSVLALEHAPFAASAHILPLSAGAHNPLVTRFEVGWACAVPSDIEKLDDTPCT
jgi:hypothetical protein